MLGLVVTVPLSLGAITNEKRGASNSTHARDPSILVQAETLDKIYACAPYVQLSQLIKSQKQSEDQRNLKIE